MLMFNWQERGVLERYFFQKKIILNTLLLSCSEYLQVYALKVMKKVGENVPAFYCEERDIMARTTSPWHTKLDYAFQVLVNQPFLVVTLHLLHTM